MPEQLFSRSRVKSGAIALVPNDSLFKHDCGLVGGLDGSTSIEFVIINLDDPF